MNDPNEFAVRSAGHELPRRALLLGAAAVASGSLAACSGNKGFQKESRPSSTGTGKSQSFSGKIVVGTYGNPPKQATDALTAAYKKRQPKVEISWETKDWPSPNDYSTWLGTQLAAGNIGVDVVSGNYASTYSGYVDLDQYRGSMNPYTKHAWDKDLDFDFARGTNALGQNIRLATESVHISWYYNKDLFARAGVQPPTTWSEFESVCGKLKAAGITPLAGDYQYKMPQWMAEIYFDQYHVDWVKTVRAQKGDWNYNPELGDKFHFDPNLPNLHTTYTFNVQRFLAAVKSGKLRYDTDEVAELVGNLAKIFPKYATSDFFVITDTYAPLLQQKVAMEIDGSWAIPSLTNDLASMTPARMKELGIKRGTFKPFQWGSFENPAMQGSLVESRVRSVESASGDYISVVNKNAQQTKLVMDFVEFWTSKPGQQPYLDAYAKTDQFNPAGPLHISNVSYPGKYAHMFDNLKFLGNAEAAYNSFWTTGGGGKSKDDLRNLLKSALQGKTSPKDYASQLQHYVQGNFDKILTEKQLTEADIKHPERKPESH